MEPAAPVRSDDWEEIKDLLEENIKLTKDTHRLLKAMRRDALISGVAKFVLWIVLIIGSLWFSAQFLAPYLSVLDSFNGSGTQGGGIGSWQDLIDKYKTELGQ